MLILFRLRTSFLLASLLALTLLAYGQKKELPQKFNSKLKQRQAQNEVAKTPTTSSKFKAESVKNQRLLVELKNAPNDVKTLQALKKEMDSNLKNADYNLQRAFSLLKASGKIMYPLKDYDPDFPLVFRTGDKKADMQRYNEAKLEWAEKKKAQLKNSSR